jgi:hypothetical protein
MDLPCAGIMRRGAALSTVAKVDSINDLRAIFYRRESFFN